MWGMQFFLVVSVYIYLPITGLHIESGEPFGSSQRVQRVVNPGQWKTVFLRELFLMFASCCVHITSNST
jgi:hypothetical protein